MTKETSDQRDDGGLALTSISRLSPAQLETLRAYWIMTVAGLVAASATGAGRSGLCQALGIEPDMLDDVLREAKGLVGTTRYAELAQPQPGGSLGVRLDRPPGGDSATSRSREEPSS